MSVRAQFDLEFLETRVLLSGEGVTLSMTPAEPGDVPAVVEEFGLTSISASELEVENATASSLFEDLASADLLAPVEPAPRDGVSEVAAQSITNPEHSRARQFTVGGAGLHTGLQTFSPLSLPMHELLPNDTFWFSDESYIWDIDQAEGTDPLFSSESFLTGWDLIEIDGTLDLIPETEPDGTPIPFVLRVVGSPDGFDASQGYSWRILHARGGVEAFEWEALKLDVSGFTPAPTGSKVFLLSRGGWNAELQRYQDLWLHYVPSLPYSLLEQPEWIEQGPFTLNGSFWADSATANNPAIGAIQTAVQHPARPGTVYVASVNGGVWRTDNFYGSTGSDTAAQPTWLEPDVNSYYTLGITSLAISPFKGLIDADGYFSATGSSPLVAGDVSNVILFAGTGSLSSSNKRGGGDRGVMRSVDGGVMWQLVSDANLDGSMIGGIVFSPTDPGRAFVTTDLGEALVYQTVDCGNTWTAASTGLPTDADGYAEGTAGDIIVDPNNPDRFFVAITDAGPNSGVYVWNEDTSRWSKSAGALTGADTALRIRLSATNGESSEPVYAAVIAPGNDLKNDPEGKLAGVYRTIDQGGVWTSVGLPASTVTTDGDGSRFFSLLAHPTDPAKLYIGAKGLNGLNLAQEASPGTWTWTSLATAPTSTTPGNSPHPDSRNMAIFGSDLVDLDDGGIYLLPSSSPTGSWVSKNGDLRITEIAHSVAYDIIHKRLIAGTQDNGVIRQLNAIRTGSSDPAAVWEIDPEAYGDGNFVAFDSLTKQSTGGSFEVFMGNNFSTFKTVEINTAGDRLHHNDVPLLKDPKSGTSVLLPDDAQFDKFDRIPMVLNSVDAKNLLVGYFGLYEGLDQGINGKLVLPKQAARFTALSYGGVEDGVGHAEVLYAAAGSELFVRSVGGKQAVKKKTFDSPVVDLAVDATDWKTAIVTTQLQVYLTIDGGSIWLDITGELGELGSLGDMVESVELVRMGDRLVALAGTSLGVRRLVLDAEYPREPAFGDSNQWTLFGLRLPTAMVTDIDYVSDIDHGGVLVLGTLGRGAWALTDADRWLSSRVDWDVFLSSTSSHVSVQQSAVPNQRPDTIEIEIDGTVLASVFQPSIGSLNLVQVGATSSSFPASIHQPQGGVPGLHGDPTATLTIDQSGGDVLIKGGIDFASQVGNIIASGLFHSAVEAREVGEAGVRVVEATARTGNYIVRTGTQVVSSAAAAAAATPAKGLEQLGTSLGGFARSISNSMGDLFANLALPLLRNGFGAALNGVSGEQVFPSADNERGAVSKALSRNASPLLTRFFESGPGGFNLSALGSSIATEIAFEDALRELGDDPTTDIVDVLIDSSDSNGDGITLRVDLHLSRYLEANAGVHESLLNGALTLDGSLNLRTVLPPQWVSRSPHWGVVNLEQFVATFG